MWLLRKLSDETVKYLISDNKTYTVGRKNCDIVLDEDASISRKHCTIYIAKQNECPFPVNTLTGVWIVDEESKYGTYLKSNNDWIKLNPNQNKKLSSGSIIKFGLIENIWSFEFKPLIVSTSGIQTEEKKKIERKVESVNGFFKNNWCKECTTLVVNEITLTVKVVLALINGVPIVTPNYVDKVIECVKNQIPFPNYENYKPGIKESILDVSLVSLDIKNNRKELFKNLKFVIPTKKQLETLKEVIICAGGKIELFSSAGNWERFAEENIVLIQLPFNSNTVSEELNKTYKEITLFLKNNYGRRIIPESEIAQAVAYSSVEKFCNPKSTCFNLLSSQRQFKSGEVLVHETPEMEMIELPDPFVIPSSATFESQLNQDLSSEINKNFQKETKKSDKKDRKRSHSPQQLDEETKAKKVKNKKNDNLDQKFEENLKKKISNDSNLEVQKSSTKTNYITNFFQKQKNCEKTSQVPKESINKFWEEDEEICENNESNKRKLSSDDGKEGEGEGNSSIRKKVKVPEEKQLSSIQSSKKVVEESSNFRKIVSSSNDFSNFGKNNIEEEINFENFIEKESKDSLKKSLNDLYTTIFSLTLISSDYLKEDGSLIEPPNVPVNVKRFQKQKIKSNIIVSSIEENNDDELSDGEWMEPHSQKNNISSHQEEEN